MTGRHPERIQPEPQPVWPAAGLGLTRSRSDPQPLLLSALSRGTTQQSIQNKGSHTNTLKNNQNSPYNQIDFSDCSQLFSLRTAAQTLISAWADELSVFFVTCSLVFRTKLDQNKSRLNQISYFTQNSFPECFAALLCLFQQSNQPETEFSLKPAKHTETHS